MVYDERDILEVLREELTFLEGDGYRGSAKQPWQGKSIFIDSPTCINYGYPYRAHPCNECQLLDFVTPEHQNQWIPCHFISLNERGETIEFLELHDNEDKLERTVKDWLQTSINVIEEERSQLAMAGCP
jgi:hypothetical protein